MQSLWTKKKSRNLLGPKNITQPLWRKKHKTSMEKKNLGQKNHVTSRDKNKSRNFSGQKKACNLSGEKESCNSWKKKCHATSRDKKIMQPIGTKKICNLSGQKNHANSWDKKILQTLGPKFMQPLGTKKIT